MSSFDYIWQLLSPKVEYANRKRACYNLWQTFSVEQQRTIYATIREKKKKGEFVDYNPYYAISNNSLSRVSQTLTYRDYYARYGTTEEQDGWKMVKPKEGNVYYERN